MKTPERKADNVTDSSGRLPAGEYNPSVFEVFNTILAAGLSASDTEKQLSEATEIISKSLIYDVTGSANALTLNKLTGTDTLTKLYNGICVLFKPIAANTGPCSLKLGTTTTPKIVKYKGVDLTAGFFAAGELYVAQYNETDDIYNVLPISLFKATTEEAIAGVNEEKAITPKTNQDHYESRAATDEEVLAGSSTDKHITPKQFASLGAFESGLNYQRDVIEDGIIRIGSIAELLMLPQILGFENMMHRKVMFTIDTMKAESLKPSKTKFSNGSTFTMCDKDLRDTPHYANALSHPFKIFAQDSRHVHTFEDMSCSISQGPGFVYRWDINNSTNEFYLKSMHDDDPKPPQVNGRIMGIHPEGGAGDYFSSVPLIQNYHVPNETEDAVTDLYGQHSYIRHFVGTITNVSFLTDPIKGGKVLDNLDKIINFYEIELDLSMINGVIQSTSSFYKRYLSVKQKAILRIGLASKSSVVIGGDVPKSYLFNYKEILNRYTSWPDSVSYNYQQLPENKKIGLITGSNFGTEVTETSPYSGFFGDLSLIVKTDMRLGGTSNTQDGENQSTQTFYGMSDPVTSGKSGNFISTGWAKSFPIGHIYPDLETLKTYSWYDESLAVEV